MKVTFIAHAGVSITEGEQEILIDPWFTDSTVRQPLIQPIAGYPTIDFQIPKTTDVPANHNPDAILVSHFHSHHAPHDDIMALVAQSESNKRTFFGYPADVEDNEPVKAAFAVWPHVDVSPMRDTEMRNVGLFSARARTHTVPKHVAWEVSSPSGSVLHIADPAFNKNNKVREIDEIWRTFAGICPSLLFINAGGNSIRREKDGIPTLLESGAVSPVEAAEIVAIIQPRIVSLIGCYNHSVWKNRQEYIPPASQIEEEFYWALSWLAPRVKFVPVKPGHTFLTGERAAHADTVIGE